MKNFLENQELKSLASSLKDTGFVQFKNEVTQSLATQALALAQAHLENFHQAKIGQGEGKSRNEEIRKDQTLWLEDSLLENLPDLKVLYNDLVGMAREELYLPVKRIECHFSLYQKGDFYKKHRDRHKGSTHRLLTVLFYLNDLASDEGGCLKLYWEGEDGISVRPEAGKVVVFDSLFEHEVEECQADRFAISGWLRDDEVLY